MRRLSPTCRPVLRALLAGLLLAGAALPAAAAARKGLRLWNLTGETLNRVELAPAGTTRFGRNQCENDRDGEVDFDEQLAITDVAPGRYDVRVRDVNGRVCLARNVDVKAEAVFAIHENDLTNCAN